jgi:uncharacterized membrane protein YfcA
MKIYSNKKSAGIMFIVLNSITIIIEALIVFKIFPYNIIGGGRFENYNSAHRAAIISIIILSLEIIFIIIVQKYNRNGKTNLFIKIILWIILSMLCINIIGNILSKTLSEKIFMGIICLLQILNVIKMIMDNKNIRKNYIINLIKQEYRK